MEPNDKVFDTAIIGSGFAGSILAMVLRQSGQRVLLIEKNRHPRFAIGESSTPLANLLLEEIARDSNLPHLLNLTEWGRWQLHHPNLPCGLKRGFTFFHHSPLTPLDPRDRSKQLLVAASPSDRVADTHWYRPAFDEFLVKEAQSCGVDYHSDSTISKLERDNGLWKMELQSNGSVTNPTAKFLVDASGPRGFLVSHFNIPVTPSAGMPGTQSLFAHFTGVRSMAECDERFATLNAPYPVDDAAVHHMIEGGWVWGLRFNNGLTSVGVVLEDTHAQTIGLSKREQGWQTLLRRYPSLEQMMERACRTTDWHYMPRVGSRSHSVVGDGWALLPSAAGFVDPMLSTGFALTLLGIQRLAKILTNSQSDHGNNNSLQAYEKITLLELDHTAELIGALYANLNNPDNIRDLTLLYFAAASYSETVRRLGKPELARSFLLCQDVSFGPESKAIFKLSRTTSNQNLRQLVHGLIEKIDIAGLTKTEGQNWYPLNLDDLLNHSDKVRSNRLDIMEMLKKNGLII